MIPNAVNTDYYQIQQNMNFQKEPSNGSSHTNSDLDTATCSIDINDTPTSGAGDRTTTITIDNVHKLSTYALRQELQKRAISFQNDDNNNSSSYNGKVVNHNVLLQKMVQILYKEKEVEEEKRNRNESKQDYDGKGSIFGNTYRNETEAIKEKLHKQKMERKKAAIERSKQRQMNKEYFMQKKTANEEGRKKNIEKERTMIEEFKDAHDSIAYSMDTGATTNEDEKGEFGSHLSIGKSSNPFATRFVPKIGGRFM